MPIALPLTDYISQQSSKSASYRIKKSELGGGIVHRLNDGINVKMERWNIIWSNVTQLQRDQLISDFDALAGWDHFLWAQFGETQIKKWVMAEDGYSYTTQGGNVYTVSTTIEREYT